MAAPYRLAIVTGTALVPILPPPPEGAKATVEKLVQLLGASRFFGSERVLRAGIALSALFEHLPTCRESPTLV